MIQLSSSHRIPLLSPLLFLRCFRASQKGTFFFDPLLGSDPRLFRRSKPIGELLPFIQWCVFDFPFLFLNIFRLAPPPCHSLITTLPPPSKKESLAFLLYLACPPACLCFQQLPIVQLIAMDLPRGSALAWTSQFLVLSSMMSARGFLPT